MLKRSIQIRGKVNHFYFIALFTLLAGVVLNSVNSTAKMTAQTLLLVKGLEECGNKVAETEFKAGLRIYLAEQ